MSHLMLGPICAKLLASAGFWVESDSVATAGLVVSKDSDLKSPEVKALMW
jgi:hypothetical protein